MCIRDRDESINALTPNDFLSVQCNPIQYTPVSDMQMAQHLAQVSRHATEMVKQFWDMWATDYFQQLRDWPAAHCFQPNNHLTQRLPGQGDVVIIKEDLRKRAV